MVQLQPLPQDMKPTVKEQIKYARNMNHLSNKKTKIGKTLYHLTITPLREYSVKKIANGSPIQNHGTMQ